MGLFSRKKKEESTASTSKLSTDENDDTSEFQQMSKKEQEAYKEEKKQREWSDVDESAKYVCQGGKITCPYASPNTADIIVTSTTIKLQDSPWATVEDKDGKTNFNFTGLCKHSSHGSNKPPCKAVINLGQWKDYSDTLIDNKNALVVKSTIQCMVSGEDLKIVDSGQITELDQVEVADKRKPTVTDVYWKEDASQDKMYIEYPDYEVTLYIETKDYNPKESVEIKFTNDEGRLFVGNRNELIVKGEVGADGIAIIKNFQIKYEENKKEV